MHVNLVGSFKYGQEKFVCILQEKQSVNIKIQVSRWRQLNEFFRSGWTSYFSLVVFSFLFKNCKNFIVMTASDEFYSTCGFSFCSGSYSSQTAFVSQILFENKLIIWISGRSREKLSAFSERCVRIKNRKVFEFCEDSETSYFAQITRR